MVAQGNDLRFRQFQVLLKFFTKIKKSVTYPEVRFKLLFAGAFEGNDEKKLRARENDAPGNYTSYDQSGHKRAMVAVPYKDTVVAEFTISSKDIFSAAGISQFENMTLTSEWHVGGQSGPIEFVIAAKASREVSNLGSSALAIYCTILPLHLRLRGCRFTQTCAPCSPSKQTRKDQTSFRLNWSCILSSALAMHHHKAYSLIPSESLCLCLV